MLEIQDLLHICCRHAIDLTVFDNVLRLREGSRHAFQNSLIVDICLHIGAGEVNIQYDPVGQLRFRVALLSQLLLDPPDLLFQFSGFSGISQQRLVEGIGIDIHILGRQPAGDSFADIEILLAALLLDLWGTIIGQQVQPCLIVSLLLQ